MMRRVRGIVALAGLAAAVLPAGALGVAGAAGAAGVVGAGPARAEIIDRVVAVVEGVIITQSDVSAATRLGLVTADQGAGAPVRDAPGERTSVRDALVERQLVVAEVDRYAPPEPGEADVAASFEAVRRRVGAAEVDRVLRETGWSDAELRRYLRDTLRIEAYLQQRFGTIEPGEAEVQEYYAAHAADFTPRTLPDAREAVVAAIARERRTAVVREWIAGLRRRANIRILPE